MRVVLLILAALVLSTTHAAALKGTGGTGGLGFSCTVGGKCYCDGPVGSADCKGAAKNCSDGVKCPCGWAVDNCCCTYSAAKAHPNTIQKVPSGTLKAQ